MRLGTTSEVYSGADGRKRTVSVLLTDEAVPRLWAVTKAAEDELQEQSEPSRIAISSARLLQYAKRAVLKPGKMVAVHNDSLFLVVVGERRRSHRRVITNSIRQYHE